MERDIVLTAGQGAAGSLWWNREVRDKMGEPSGLEQTVKEIFTALRDPVYRYLYSILANRGDAEDLTQEAFVRLFRHLRKGQAIDNARAWLFRVAHNLAIDFCRRPPAPESLDAPDYLHVAEEL